MRKGAGQNSQGESLLESLTLKKYLRGLKKRIKTDPIIYDCLYCCDTGDRYILHQQQYWKAEIKTTLVYCTKCVDDFGDRETKNPYTHRRYEKEVTREVEYTTKNGEVKKKKSKEIIHVSEMEKFKSSKFLQKMRREKLLLRDIDIDEYARSNQCQSPIFLNLNQESRLRGYIIRVKQKGMRHKLTTQVLKKMLDKVRAVGAIQADIKGEIEKEITSEALENMPGYDPTEELPF